MPATTCVSLYTACHYLPLALKPMSGLGLRGVATGKHWQLLAGSEPWLHPACHFACQSQPTKLHLDRWPYTDLMGWGATADTQLQLGAGAAHTNAHTYPTLTTVLRVSAQLQARLFVGFFVLPVDGLDDKYRDAE
jgi:hypothetical protein